jgi:hypothetical protein
MCSGPAARIVPSLSACLTVTVVPAAEPLLAALDPAVPGSPAPELEWAALLDAAEVELLLEDLLLPQPAASRADAPSTAIAAALGVFMKRLPAFVDEYGARSTTAGEGPCYA